MTLQSLAKQLSDYSDKLEEGTLTSEEIRKLTAISRDFYERMIVLQYKTIEQSLAALEATPPATVEDQQPPQPQVQSSDEQHASEPLISDIEAEPAAPPDAIPDTPAEPSPPARVDNPPVGTPPQESGAAKPADTEKPAESTPNTVAEDAAPFIAPASLSGSGVSPNQISLIDSIEEIKQMEKSLNEKLKKEGPSLADQLHKKPISNLRSSLTINQKFQFISHLFDNDAEAFESTFSRLDACHSFIEADEYIQNNLKSHYDWEMKSPVVQDLIDMVERRFL